MIIFVYPAEMELYGEKWIGYKQVVYKLDEHRRKRESN